jgi:hypothetical protein
MYGLYKRNARIYECMSIHFHQWILHRIFCMFVDPGKLRYGHRAKCVDIYWQLYKDMMDDLKRT